MNGQWRMGSIICTLLCTTVTAQTQRDALNQDLWWIMVAAIGGPLIILVIVFLCCYFKCFERYNRYKLNKKKSSAVAPSKPLTLSIYKAQFYNMLKGHHPDCTCDNCQVRGHHESCHCNKCFRAKQVSTHKHWECLSCSVSLLHGSKLLLCSCKACENAIKHREDMSCPCSTCEVAGSHMRDIRCPCGECQRIVLHRQQEKRCNCASCQDGRLHEARLELKHIQTCFYCRIAALHKQQTSCTCPTCSEARTHKAKYECRCRLCVEAVEHSRFLMCDCSSCSDKDKDVSDHQAQSGCLCKKCVAVRDEDHNVCIEEKKNMNGLTEKRLSSDSGIEGGGLCPPNNLCTQPAITKECIRWCEGCGEYHRVENRRRRASSVTSNEVEPDSHKMRKTKSMECVDKVDSSCNTSTTSIGVQAHRTTARIHWKPSCNPMLTQNLHVFDRDRYWKLQSDYVEDVKARREAYRQKTKLNMSTN